VLSHAQEQVFAVHSGHIEIEDRKIEGGKIATQCLYGATKQNNCVALQLQNLPEKLVPVSYRRHRGSAFVRSQIGYDLPGWLRFSFTGFPVEVGGVGEHHAPFFKERRTRGSV
jgi:hypothetical protein